MKVELLGYPGEREWAEVRRRCLVTAGRSAMGCRTERHCAHIAVNRKTIRESTKKEKKINDLS